MITTLPLSIHAIRDEACQLVARGSLQRSQPIHSLCKFYSDREWHQIEQELELNYYLLRDSIGDLVGREEWSWD